MHFKKAGEQKKIEIASALVYIMLPQLNEVFEIKEIRKS